MMSQFASLVLYKNVSSRSYFMTVKTANRIRKLTKYTANCILCENFNTLDVAWQIVMSHRIVTVL